ncbi:MAG: pantoate--beta-alanine ligase [Candidatus Eiseniibacteriota bacterium]
MTNPTRPLGIARTVSALRTRVKTWRDARQTVGLVPTMGALHDGHMALVRAALAENDRVVVSLFVNPKQFAPTEDLAAYPRRESDDAEKLSKQGVDLLFAPTVAEMYPEGFASTVAVGGLTERLEGAARPHHFAGVTTVVTKLLMQVMPDRAYFGEKDFQQLQIIRQMTRDLDIPIEIRGVPIVREAGGLALSSRNEYLSEEQRVVARNLNRVLQQVADAVAGGADPRAAEKDGVAALAAAGFDSVDYVAVCDAETLQPLAMGATRTGRALAAARVGKTRLIDNFPVPRK